MSSPTPNAGARAGRRLAAPAPPLGAAARRLSAPITPASGAIVAAACAIVVLVLAQFADLQQVRAGAADYNEVARVAPAPLIESTRLGPSHAWSVLPLAALAGAALWLAATRRRWRLARALMPIGATLLAITLLVDLPRGTEQSDLAATYAGAEASLGPGFSAQLAAAVALIALGPILSAKLRPRRAGGRRERMSATRPKRAAAPAADSNATRNDP